MVTPEKCNASHLGLSSSWTNICHLQIARGFYLQTVSSQRISGRGRNQDAHCRVTSSMSLFLLTTRGRGSAFQPVFLLHRTGPARSGKCGNSSSLPGPTTVSQNTRHLSSLSFGESRPVTLRMQARWLCTAGKSHREHLFFSQSGVWGDRKLKWFLIA